MVFHRVFRVSLYNRMPRYNQIEVPHFVVSSDPPYYDNIGYADLSDFFYVWLRRALEQIYPSLLSTVLVPKTDELIADPSRQGGQDAARQFFEQGLRKTFAWMSKTQVPEVP